MSLKNSKIIVIKIGSSLLVDSNRRIKRKWLSSFAKDIQKLRNANKKIILVSAIDNLIKGAAGQAVQCLNISENLDETKSLL